MLFSGDTLQVAMDRRRVSFMHSYPNAIPLPHANVRGIRDRLAGIRFDRVYGYNRGRNILGGARAAVDASLDAYLRRDHPSLPKEPRHD